MLPGLLICGLLYHSNAFVVADTTTPSCPEQKNHYIMQLDAADTDMNPQNPDSSLAHRRSFFNICNNRHRRTMHKRLGASDLFISTRGGGDNDTKNNSSPISTIRTWYMNQLEAHELPTKFISSGILALIGDVIAQIVGHHFMLAKSTTSEAIRMTIDKRRMLALFMDGVICTGPLLHYIYEFYEWILPTHDKDIMGTDGEKDTLAEANDLEKTTTSKRKFMAALTHVLFDNFVMIFVYIALLILFTGVVESRYTTLLDGITELRNELMPSVKVSWKVSAMGYAPAQLLAFHFLPMKLRVLAVNCLDLIWVTVMSYVTHRNRH